MNKYYCKNIYNVTKVFDFRLLQINAFSVKYQVQNISFKKCIIVSTKILSSTTAFNIHNIRHFS